MNVKMARFDGLGARTRTVDIAVQNNECPLWSLRTNEVKKSVRSTMITQRNLQPVIDPHGPHLTWNGTSHSTLLIALLIIMSWTIKQQMDNTWYISCSNDNFLEQHLVWNKRINKLWISVPLREVREWTSPLTESNFCKALNRRGSDCLVPSPAELAVDLPIGTEILRETNCCSRGAQLKFHGGSPNIFGKPKGQNWYVFSPFKGCVYQRKKLNAQKFGLNGPSQKLLRAVCCAC